MTKFINFTEVDIDEMDKPVRKTRIIRQDLISEITQFEIDDIYGSSFLIRLFPQKGAREGESFLVCNSYEDIIRQFECENEN